MQGKLKMLECVCPVCHRPLHLKDLEIGFSLYCAKCYQKEFGTGLKDEPNTKPVVLKGIKK